MAGGLVPFQGPGGVITFLQPDNPLVAGGSNVPSLLSRNSPTPGGTPRTGDYCRSPDGSQTINTVAGSCPAGWTLIPALGAGPNPTAGSTEGGVTPAGPPNIISGNNSPGQFIGNAVSGPLDFLNRLWAVLTNRDYWKAIGLIVGGAALVLVGLHLYGEGGAPVIVRTKVIARPARSRESEDEEDAA